MRNFDRFFFGEMYDSRSSQFLLPTSIYLFHELKFQFGLMRRIVAILLSDFLRFRFDRYYIELGLLFCIFWSVYYHDANKELSVRGLRLPS